MRLLIALIVGLTAFACIRAGEIKFIDDNQFLDSVTQSVMKMKEEGKLKSSKELLENRKAGKAILDLCKPTGTSLAQKGMYDNLSDKVLVHCVSYKCGKCSKLHLKCSTTYAIADDVVVFNYHALGNSGEEHHAVSDRNGRAFAVTEVIAVDKDNDITIARVEGAKFKPFAITPDEPVGNPVLVISNPKNMFYVLTAGIISRYYISTCSCGGKKCGKAKGNWMSITADYAKGSSGAPIINMNGNLVGMVSSTSSIYYNEEDGKHDNLQMVVKNCVPSRLILKLIRDRLE